MEGNNFKLIILNSKLITNRYANFCGRSRKSGEEI